MTNAVVIYWRNGFRLTSYGNGWAHLLEWLNSSGEREKSVWFQDDSSTDFRAEFDAAMEAGSRITGPEDEVERLSDRIVAGVFREYECAAQTDADAM